MINFSGYYGQAFSSYFKLNKEMIFLVYFFNKKYIFFKNVFKWALQQTKNVFYYPK